jgi:hypothetical protein
MIITNAKYRKVYGTDVNSSVTATIDETECSIPLDPANRHYAEIMRQVDAGELTIEPADE